MSGESVLRALFDRWEKVWHEGRFDLVAGCVAPVYIRHDELGTRTVTPDEYAAELAANRQARPSTYIAVYDHEFFGNRAWFRFALMWSDSLMGEARTRAGMQLYRIEDGKLAETWVTLLGANSSWPDATAQERWTSKRAGM
jgi:SnoaL-like domain